MKPAISREQERLMRHALGVGEGGAKTPYRNRFATFMGGEAYNNWADLCRKGLAEHWDTAESGMMFFAVTLDGHARIGVTPEGR